MRVKIDSSSPSKIRLQISASNGSSIYESVPEEILLPSMKCIYTSLQQTLNHKGRAGDHSGGGNAL